MAKTEFVNTGTQLCPIWTAIVGKHKINVVRAHGNLHEWTFMIFPTRAKKLDSVLSQGYSGDLRSAMRKGLVRVNDLNTAKLNEVANQTVLSII